MSRAWGFLFIQRRGAKIQRLDSGGERVYARTVLSLQAALIHLAILKSFHEEISGFPGLESDGSPSAHKYPIDKLIRSHRSIRSGIRRFCPSYRMNWRGELDKLARHPSLEADSHYEEDPFPGHLLNSLCRQIFCGIAARGV